MTRKLPYNYLSNFFFLLIAFLNLPVNTYSQLLAKSNLDTCLKFQSIQEALQSPDEVFVLDLSKNKLKAFPKEILKFKNLQKLILFKNKIDSIPANIKSLKNLQYLNLGKNKLETFPKGITELNNLNTLILNQNNISSIPDNIDGLYNLEYLDMWSNNIGYISDNIKFLTKLNELDLRVIIFSNDEKERIRFLLPGTEVYFSNSCNCGY